MSACRSVRVCLCGCVQVFELPSSNLSLLVFFLQATRAEGEPHDGPAGLWRFRPINGPRPLIPTEPTVATPTCPSVSASASRQPCQMAGWPSSPFYPAPLSSSSSSPLGACWQWADLEEGCRCDKYRWPRLFSSQTFLIPHRLLTFFNWSKHVMCNQLPSGSIFHSQSDRWLTGEPGWLLASQPGGASAKPNRCQEREIQQRSVTSFIRDIFLLLSFWQTFSDFERGNVCQMPQCLTSVGRICCINVALGALSWLLKTKQKNRKGNFV